MPLTADVAAQQVQVRNCFNHVFDFIIVMIMNSVNNIIHGFLPRFKID